MMSDVSSPVLLMICVIIKNERQKHQTMENLAQIIKLQHDLTAACFPDDYHFDAGL